MGRRLPLSRDLAREVAVTICVIRRYEKMA